MNLFEHISSIDSILCQIRESEAEQLLMSAGTQMFGAAFGSGFSSQPHHFTIQHGQWGQPDVIRDESGSQTTLQHGEFGLPDLIRDASGHQATYEHGHFGQPDILRDDAGHHEQQDIGVDGEPVHVQLPSLEAATWRSS